MTLEKTKTHWCPKCGRKKAISIFTARTNPLHFQCQACGSYLTAADLELKTVTLIKAIPQ